MMLILGAGALSQKSSATFTKILSFWRPHMPANKYGARKTQVDGITFDSRAEAKYYEQLNFRKVLPFFLNAS